MQYTVAFLIGFFSGQFIPIYNFKTHIFSFKNLLILILLETVWYFLYEKIFNKDAR